MFFFPYRWVKYGLLGLINPKYGYIWPSNGLKQTSIL